MPQKTKGRVGMLEICMSRRMRQTELPEMGSLEASRSPLNTTAFALRKDWGARVNAPWEADRPSDLLALSILCRNREQASDVESRRQGCADAGQTCVPLKDLLHIGSSPTITGQPTATGDQ
jgi:hypothetical protein